MATDFDFTEDTAAPEVQDFGFQEEPAIPQLQFPTLPPGATLADFLNQQPPIMQPWEGGVVRSALPGSLQPEDLLPAVRKIGGELSVGEQGDTHPDIIEREGIPAVEIDQRGFMGPQGEFYDRESAAQGTGLPTEREPGRLHSTDLPAFESPVAITDKGPVYASDTGKPIPSTGEEPWTFGQVVSAPLKGAGMVIADILNRARMEGAGLPEVTAPQAIISPEGIRMETEEERKNRLSFGGEKPLYVPRGTALAPQGNELQRLISQWSTPESLALLPAGMSRAGAALIMTQMVPGIVGDIKAIVSGEGTEEEKRDRINNLFSMAILAAHGAGKERPQAERASAQVTETRPSEAVTPAPEPVATKPVEIPTEKKPSEGFVGKPLDRDVIWKQLEDRHNIKEGGVVEVYNDPTSIQSGEVIFDKERKPTSIRINQAQISSPAQLNWIIEHEASHWYDLENFDLAGKLQEQLTTGEWESLFSKVVKLGYSEDAIGNEITARGIQTLADSWKGRGWFDKLVGNVQRFAFNNLGMKLTRKASESTAVRAIAQSINRISKAVPSTPDVSAAVDVWKKRMSEVAPSGTSHWKAELSKLPPPPKKSNVPVLIRAEDGTTYPAYSESQWTPPSIPGQEAQLWVHRYTGAPAGMESKYGWSTGMLRPGETIVAGEAPPKPAEAPKAAAAPAAKVEPKPVNWDRVEEDLIDNLDSFAPARTTGRINYELNDLATRFVKYAKKDTTGRPLHELIDDFADEDGTPKGQLRKLRESVKALSTAPSVEPKPAAPEAAPTIAHPRFVSWQASQGPEGEWFVSNGIKTLRATGGKLQARKTAAELNRKQVRVSTSGQLYEPTETPSIGAGIQAALARKSEAGAVTVPAPIAKAVEKTRDTITTLIKTKGVRDTMAYTKDEAGSSAMVYGQRVGNDIRGELRRVMGRTKKPNVLDENALTFVREANGDRSQLGVMRAKLNASTVANPKWKNAALKAIDHADANWDRLNPIASQYEGATHAQIMAENNAGINTVERPGYVMHAQDVKNEFGFFSDVAGEGTTGFKHVRTHDTLADSIAAGVDPKSINAVTLLTQRVARGQMLINNRAWVEGLKGTIDPMTRKSVITEPEVISRGPGLPPDTRAPEGYVMEIAGGRPIAILKPYAGIFRALTEPSKFSESLGWNMALKAATTGKSISLLIDTFHLGRIAFWESIIKPLSFTDPKLPMPSYKRGVLTLDYSPAELNRMAQAGEIDPAHLTDILQAQRDVNGLVKHGYNIAKISDMLHQEWMQKIPITGGFTKWLFNQFQRGAMAEVGSLEVGRYRRMHPSWTEERVYREVAKDLNTRFGNLGRQGILKSRTAQDTARLLFLAPQWNEGLIRSELGAITGAVKGIASTAKEGRLSFGILPRAVGAMIVAQFAANQIINYITRGKPTWQNEEEGLGAKLSAWVPDVVGKGPGFFLHPLGLAAEVTHLLSQKYEKKGDAREAIMAFMGGRLSTLSRPLMTFLTRRDIFQRLIRPEKIWGETAKSAIPSPIGAQAVVPAIGERLGGEPKEPFVGAYQKQMMSSAGIKTDQAPSPGQRIQTLAQKFKKERGITTPGEFYGSAYTPLRDAIQRGAMKESLAEYDRLLDTVAPSGKRYTPEQIDNAMKPWTGGRLNKQTYQVTPRKAKTFTGSAAKEREFINTLTPEQKATYRRAYEDRLQFYKNFREMLKARPKATNEFGFVPLE